MLKNIFTVILIYLIFQFISFAQGLPQYKLNEIIVTGSRTPLKFNEITRNIIVITQDQIKNYAVTSVPELIQFASGVNLEQRGVNGLQADAQIRGGTFEQTLILIDGIRVNDPQTGHHNFNLPITLNDIDRIEILKGQGSSIYGPDAFSGIINIVTKKAVKDNLTLQAEGGQNGYFSGEGSGSLIINNFSNQLSFSKQKSDGYIHNTNFDIINYAYRSSLLLNKWQLNFQYGSDEKRFGANSFYSVLFPNQWEHTRTKFSDLKIDYIDSAISLSGKLYLRRNYDNFLLNYEDPAFYENNHQTNMYGGEIQSSLRTDIGVTTLGAEISKDKITSNSLGDHQRENDGIFGEQKIALFKDLTFIGNAYLYNYSNIGWKFWPGISFGYKITEGLRLFGSVGKSFRVPTYTELYYSSPASIGNQNLLPEESTNYELGGSVWGNFYYSLISFFFKKGENLIDWARKNSEEPWKVMNVLTLNTEGIDISTDLYPKNLLESFPINKINFSYTYLNTEKNNIGYKSEYLLNYPRHQFILSLTNDWLYEVTQSWNFQYEKNVETGTKFLLNSQIMKHIRNFEIYFKATNLLNKTYREINGVPLPGRLWYVGLRWELE